MAITLMLIGRLQCIRTDTAEPDASIIALLLTDTSIAGEAVREAYGV